MKKRFKKIAKIIIVVSMIQIIIFALNPARWPEKVIRWTILNEIPIGTTLKKAQKIINGIVKEPEVGEIYSGKVTKIMAFGAFVEILPNKDLHNN